jgi:hypothetical protein
MTKIPGNGHSSRNAAIRSELVDERLGLMSSVEVPGVGDQETQADVLSP